MIPPTLTEAAAATGGAVRAGTSAIVTADSMRGARVAARGDVMAALPGARVGDANRAVAGRAVAPGGLERRHVGAPLDGRGVGA